MLHACATSHLSRPLQLYAEFISKFEGRLSQIRLAMLVSMIAHLYSDPNAALAFLEKALTARNRLGAEAALCLDMDVVVVRLKLGQSKEAKEALEGAKKTISGMISTEPVVFSRFYMATAEYRKVGALGPFHRRPHPYYASLRVNNISLLPLPCADAVAVAS